MKIKDLILEIENLTFDEVLEYLVKKSQEKGLPAGRQGKKTFVVTVNPEIAMLAKDERDYEKVLKSADLALPDGIGIVWAGKVFGKSFNGRIHGVDLVDRLCKEVSKKPITVGFLGGQQNVALRTANRLTEKYPELQVAFALEEWEELRARGPVTRFPPGSAHSRFTDSALPGDPSTRVTPRESIINHSCDILFVALGSPKQEMWIYENLPKIDVRLAIGVGGAFDFISGKVHRAPVWIRSLGLEWLFRLIIQPWRAKRQTALIKFVFLVLKERFL